MRASTTEILSAPLWDQDDVPAEVRLRTICKHSSLWLDDTQALDTIVQFLDGFCLSKHPLRHWQDLRATLKGTSRLMRQFCNLPYGSKLVA